MGGWARLAASRREAAYKAALDVPGCGMSLSLLAAGTVVAACRCRWRRARQPQPTAGTALDILPLPPHCFLQVLLSDKRTAAGAVNIGANKERMKASGGMKGLSSFERSEGSWGQRHLHPAPCNGCLGLVFHGCRSASLCLRTVLQEKKAVWLPGRMRRFKDFLEELPRLTLSLISLISVCAGDEGVLGAQPDTRRQGPAREARHVHALPSQRRQDQAQGVCGVDEWVGGSGAGSARGIVRERETLTTLCPASGTELKLKVRPARGVPEVCQGYEVLCVRAHRAVALGRRGR